MAHSWCVVPYPAQYMPPKFLFFFSCIYEIRKDANQDMRAFFFHVGNGYAPSLEPAGGSQPHYALHALLPYGLPYLTLLLPPPPSFPAAAVKSRR